MRASLFLAAALIAASPARSHDFWSDGEPVPEYVKADCCGKADAHHLQASAVHVMPDGYHIDGLPSVIPISKALPSPDGQYWIFFSKAGLPDPMIFCFFAPLNGV